MSSSPTSEFCDYASNDTKSAQDRLEEEIVAEVAQHGNENRTREMAFLVVPNLTDRSKSIRVEISVGFFDEITTLQSKCREVKQLLANSMNMLSELDNFIEMGNVELLRKRAAEYGHATLLLTLGLEEMKNVSDRTKSKMMDESSEVRELLANSVVTETDNIDTIVYTYIMEALKLIGEMRIFVEARRVLA